jgi:hypothetical protein
MLLNKLVLAGNNSAFSQSGRFQEIQEVCPDRKSLTSDITDFHAGDGDHPFAFLTV